MLALVLSCATCYASPHNSYEVTVLCQVDFSLPCFLFPSGIHLRATLLLQSWSNRRTCLSHLNRWCLISSTTLRQFVFLYRSYWRSFLASLRHIFQRHPLWNVLIFFMLLSSTCQHYSSILEVKEMKERLKIEWRECGWQVDDLHLLMGSTRAWVWDFCGSWEVKAWKWVGGREEIRCGLEDVWQEI